MENTIDLAAIEKATNLIKSRCKDIEKYGKIGVPGKDDVCFRYMQAKKIAQALEALPKLVAHLRHLKSICEEEISEFNIPELNTLLIEFETTKTESNG